MDHLHQVIVEGNGCFDKCVLAIYEEFLNLVGGLYVTDFANPVSVPPVQLLRLCPVHPPLWRFLVCTLHLRNTHVLLTWIWVVWWYEKLISSFKLLWPFVILFVLSGVSSPSWCKRVLKLLRIKRAKCHSAPHAGRTYKKLRHATPGVGQQQQLSYPHNLVIYSTFTISAGVGSFRSFWMRLVSWAFALPHMRTRSKLTKSEGEPQQSGVWK